MGVRSERSGKCPSSFLYQDRKSRTATPYALTVWVERSADPRSWTHSETKPSTPVCGGCLSLVFPPA